MSEIGRFKEIEEEWACVSGNNEVLNNRFWEVEIPWLIKELKASRKREKGTKIAIGEMLADDIDIERRMLSGKSKKR